MAYNVAAPLDADLQPVPAARAKSTHPEAALHAACAAYLRLREKRGDLRFHSNLPEGKRDPKRAGWFKAMSGRSGFPDLTIMWVGGKDGPGSTRYPCIAFVELKSDKGRLSEQQMDWMAWLTGLGWPYHIVRDVQELARLFP